MTKWTHKIDIKQFFGEGAEFRDEDSLPITIRHNITTEMKKVPQLKEFWEKLENENEVGSVEQFNEFLEELYDYCDERFIWLGF